MDGSIGFEQVGKVGVVTLDRPDALNALHRNMLVELEATLARVEQSNDIRALLITGSGRAFCAGIDLFEAEDDVTGDGIAEVERSLLTIQNLTRIVMRLPVPTIAAINGLAVGMGSEICIACDIRVAAADAYLWFPEARRGLFQSNGVMYLLPRLVGYGRSMEWMMSSRKIRSEELHASGLVAQVFDVADFRAAAIDYARGIANNSPLSLKLLKEVGQKAFSASYEEVVQMEIECMDATMKSEYAREGLRAFAEKRDPNF